MRTVSFSTIIRNSKGEVMAALLKKMVGALSPEMAEAKAMGVALSLARTLKRYKHSPVAEVHQERPDFTEERGEAHNDQGPFSSWRRDFQMPEMGIKPIY
ncbi:hypothetical protein TorRG33x02_248000 [Trema orientale]|uniref:RNase H type-1 domain-containing protein n=1 Tax=Trema orientale TaxID=63057 RepID=A0A2P5DL69_TREOI|nr:hypothetical protein TorRG33x02_248000 [Trema orientale]